jgi:excisionase family DNA binding protein
MDNQQRAFAIVDFCRRYGVSRSKAYDEIRSGRLTAVKVGRRTLIKDDDAERWLASLHCANIEKAANPSVAL